MKTLLATAVLCITSYGQKAPFKFRNVRLREFYNLVVAKHAEQIVLKKK